MEITKELRNLAAKNGACRRALIYIDARPGITLAELTIEDRAWVTEQPAAPPEVLAELANDPDSIVRWGVANHPLTPLDELVELANDPDKDVRRVLASNRSAPSDVLTKLASDPDKDVRLEVAKNPVAPPEALTKLVIDPDVYVQQVAESRVTC